jgi:NAD(P)H-hydrate repair Nnr-like enzyme with NAD(P)H-hydrate epimerase domain
MYKISKNVRKYSPTPIVRVTVGADGQEKEEIVLIACGQGKKAGDALSARIVTLLNSNVN